jgi:DNA polymerase III subunit gamma/tau
MRGTTSPRLVLELACARVLLPGAASDTSALLARLDRLERRLSVTADAPAPAAAAAIPDDALAPVSSPVSQAGQSELAVSESTDNVAPVPAPVPAPVAAPVTTPGALDIVAIRRLWPDLLDAVNQKNKTATALLRNAEPTAVDAKTLTVTFSTSQLANMFAEKSVFLRDALHSAVGVEFVIAVAVSGAAPTAGRGAPAAAPALPEDTDVDLSDDADAPAAEVAPHDPVALLQSNLGAEVIGEVDNS